MVVVLAQSLVLFLFSSSSLSSFLKEAGLPSIPLVPISSSQVIIGCVLGIGIYKGVSNINFNLLGQIAAGWIATPLITCILTYLSLFFFKNMFNINVGYRITESAGTQGPIQTIADPRTSEIIRYLLLGILVAGFILIIYFYMLERKKRKDLLLSEEKFWKNIK
jgi:phosphate/sulfate permease